MILQSKNSFIFGVTMKNKSAFIIFLVGAWLLLAACSSITTAASGDKLRVLATTSIVGDVVSQVGGDTISLTVMMPLGTDPHDFQPRPQDAAALVDAQVIFANGAGLEQFLQPMFQSSGATGKLVEVSSGITLLTLPGGDPSSGDPHTWMDPNNVIIWIQNISSVLTAEDSTNASLFQANSNDYIASLHDLDTWIRTQVAQIPQQDRLLVEDHAVLGYFAARYGFTQVGTITGSFSSEAAPSAQEVAALEDKIRQTGVKAIFVSEAVNQPLADQIAADTSIKSIFIYHASLTAPDGPAPTYLEFMRYNVTAIVEALK
jgi:ABC-type Zn uptake system ZnuABC Zn-binding protein ZnuA